jgi:hypothetical protein
MPSEASAGASGSPSLEQSNRQSFFNKIRHIERFSSDQIMCYKLSGKVFHEVKIINTILAGWVTTFVSTIVRNKNKIKRTPLKRDEAEKVLHSWTDGRR